MTSRPVTTPTLAASTRAGIRVSTRRLVHIYRTEGHDVAALSGVDLDVDPGEVVGLLGPSGAGKSTLLSLLGGLFRPSAGKIFLDADELSSVSARRLDELRATRVSLMLQGASRNLVPFLTPRQNVAYAQGAARAAGADVPDPDDVLARVGLAGFADRDLSALTPGHLQLAAVAVAVAPGPGLLLADEPTSQLEHEAADRVLETITRVSADTGTTVVLVTHDPAVAARLPRTVTIRDGKIGGEGRSGEEYAVVTADGFLPLPAHALADLPPGTLLRFHLENGRYTLIPGGDDEPGPTTGPDDD
jgi:ABC-type lipoprotein export system ATPase subunit